MDANPAEAKADTLARRQLAMFESISEEAKLTPADQCRILQLDRVTWQAWRRFLANGPRPLDPPVPDMLSRVGELSFHLVCCGGG